MFYKGKQRSAYSILSGTPADGDPIEKQASIHAFQDTPVIRVGIKIEVDHQQLYLFRPEVARAICTHILFNWPRQVKNVPNLKCWGRAEPYHVSSLKRLEDL